MYLVIYLYSCLSLFLFEHFAFDTPCLRVVSNQRSALLLSSILVEHWGLETKAREEVTRDMIGNVLKLILVCGFFPALFAFMFICLLLLLLLYFIYI